MDETQAMHHALVLAARGLGRVEPNPMVGAVLLREGAVIGEGFHASFGGPHAEVAALADCRAKGHDPAGATIVVTLEPCSHHGKTPPCAEALIEAQVGRVVAAMRDPFAEIAGKGFAKLEAAGVEVEVGRCEAEARELNRAWLKRVEAGRPWVIAKWAQTLDGRTATRSGDSKWISNEQSRQRVHELRGRVDAILVGAGTAIADDPSLTARPDDKEKILRVARRLVADRSSRFQGSKPDAKLWTDDGPPISVLSGNLSDELKTLAAEGVTNLLVEGGATLIGSMLRDGLIDELQVYIAPKIVGDAEAVPAVRGLSCELIADATGLRLQSAERLGEDVFLNYLIR